MIKLTGEGGGGSGHGGGGGDGGGHVVPGEPGLPLSLLLLQGAGLHRWCRLLGFPGRKKNDFLNGFLPKVQKKEW